MKGLGDAEIKFKSEKVKLRLEEAKNQKLERDLTMEKDLIRSIEEEEDKPQQNIPIDGRKGMLTEDAELFLDTYEHVFYASDSVNYVRGVEHVLDIIHIRRCE
ncbi:hypothetical protein Tco_0866214 [Tanacetum coccineum]